MEKFNGKKYIQREREREKYLEVKLDRERRIGDVEFWKRKANKD